MYQLCIHFPANLSPQFGNLYQQVYIIRFIILYSLRHHYCILFSLTCFWLPGGPLSPNTIVHSLGQIDLCICNIQPFSKSHIPNIFYYLKSIAVEIGVWQNNIGYILNEWTTHLTAPPMGDIGTTRLASVRFWYATKSHDIDGNVIVCNVSKKETSWEGLSNLH